jgi:hypothetical protein
MGLKYGEAALLAQRGNIYVDNSWQMPANLEDKVHPAVLAAVSGVAATALLLSAARPCLDAYQPREVLVR